MSATAPCRESPDRWFDLRYHRESQELCMRCPVRGACARAALRAKAQHGMWAGIWIDGDFERLRPYLQAAADAPPPAAHRDIRPKRQHANRIRSTRHRPPLPRPGNAAPCATDPVSTASLIAARSSGHCEIMAPGCTFGFDHLCSRIRTKIHTRPRTSAAGYGTCSNCREIVSHMDGRIARKLGYSVSHKRRPEHVPFYWRQTGWRLLDLRGCATDVVFAA
jgi:hypothetical protein